ncbi:MULTISPECIES: pyridoxine 5'-phosphate synthase [unclassified Undibacterium]|uniref:pyridoxine 5'-phosphate synthase n=1 Tax=unclassified Undibacterium TaxID=2630295 RepID=UPI002AC8B400|nr:MULTISPECIES: pyridoxine 5'-phosphate synthase [unclassified Undibacterium]MEB0138929.1 pyridoxine 5'-phosphate synthase [Undibacterium sp. CCC2.1]MEB0171740.1 pyridoxine 5'-phosphate synthase [Undibacterium sp. CCC1.1]MEB0175560.1 pyridoxine 5'-phosphate synthase [Undibacterium sp. CCC3.4]MEB0214942.1 pyridoxine 5'-phosphate synthase [Undibacterium sp. 5I2]WPX44924.1 pyridoxine 5'-phosphate synthase [Undibacterium sp. CCC3.4]
MTALSININKIALLRNSRGRNYPDVLAFSARCLDLGVGGITLHPRQDQRHARYSDVAELAQLCRARGAELNVEGYPSAEFIEVVKQYRPAQCTLVPDAPDQLTSDHGWDLRRDAAQLAPVLAELDALGIRTSLFVDVDNRDLPLARELGAARIELYTEPYAETYGQVDAASVFAAFQAAALCAQQAGLGVNAGHDLNLDNLGKFLQIPGILEVSIGHAVIVESLELGMNTVIGRYLDIIRQAGSRT